MTEGSIHDTAKTPPPEAVRLWLLQMTAVQRAVIWGGTSKARIIHQTLLESQIEPIAIFDPHLSHLAFDVSCPIINDPADFKRLLPQATHFVTAVGRHRGLARYTISRFLQELGLAPLTLIHRTAFVDPTATVGYGCQIMPRAVLHCFSEIGAFSVINTSAVVDHECSIGNGVHVMGSAAIAGRVRIDDFASIGTNATILPELSIGVGAYVGAGCVVTRSVSPFSVVVGVPGNRLRYTSLEVDLRTLLAIDARAARRVAEEIHIDDLGRLSSSFRR